MRKLVRMSSGKKAASVAAGLAAAIVVATPGMAQKGVPQADNPMAEALAFCATAAADMSGGTLSAAGWSIDDQGDYGPYFRSLDVSRNGGDDYGYVSVQPYNTVELVYCTYDVAIDAAFDVAPIAEAMGFDGHAQVVDGTAYGTWEQTGDGEGRLVQTSMFGDYFYLELSWIRDLP